MYQYVNQDNFDVSEYSESISMCYELEQRMELALETYSNVHRGSGHFSRVSTCLFEHARSIVLDYLNLNKSDYCIIFCTSYSAELLQKRLYYKNYRKITSADIGLPFGVTALAIRKHTLYKGIPFYTGGSTVKIVSPNSVIWAGLPQRFEAGTPNIINSIAFAVALQLLKNNKLKRFQYGNPLNYSAEQLLYHDELSGFNGSFLLEELRKLLIGKDVRVPFDEGRQTFINFDNAASTPAFMPVWNVVKKVMKLPVSSYKDIVREVEEIIFSFLNADKETYDIVFTGSTTESINIAASLIRNEFQGEEFFVLTTVLEHNSNELPWRYSSGASVIRLDADANGFINIHELEQMLQKYNGDESGKRIRIVAVSGASNVLGTFNDLSAIGHIVHKYGAKLLVDGAQLVAHRKTDLKKTGADYFVFSGHKIYAPFGSGVLLYRKNDFKKSLPELQKIKCAGIENIIGIAAIGKSLNMLQRIGMDVVERQEQNLTRQLLNYLSNKKELEVYGIQHMSEIVEKSGNVSFSLKKVPHNLVAMELAEKGGIGVRNGCFCSHLLVKKLLNIHPFRAKFADLALILMPRYTSNVLPGMIRVSFGIQNHDSEVVNFAWTLEKILHESRSQTIQNAASSYNGINKLPETSVSKEVETFVKDRLQKVFYAQ